VTQFLQGVNAGIAFFHSHVDEGIEYIAENLGYTAQDARDWLKTVRHVGDATKVDPTVISTTLTILQKAGVIKHTPSLSSIVVPSALTK
jgi:predicted transcriptional regulator